MEPSGHHVGNPSRVCKLRMPEMQGRMIGSRHSRLHPTFHSCAEPYVSPRVADGPQERTETLDEAFPASDPPPYSRTSRSGAPPRGTKIKRVEDPASGPDADVSKDQEKPK